jgi:hypothetical protein
MLSKKRLLVGAFLSSVGILLVAYALDIYSAEGLYFVPFFSGVILIIFGIAFSFSPDPNQYIVVEEVEVDPDLQIGNGPRPGDEGNSYLPPSEEFSMER